MKISHGITLLSIFIKKLVKFIPLFYKYRKKFPANILKNLYYSMVPVYPNLVYGIELLSTNKNLNKIVNINNKILRIIQFKNLSSNVIDLYNDYNTLPFDKLICYKILQLMHIWFYNRNVLPEFLMNLFTLKIDKHNYNTRNMNNLYVVNCRTKKYRTSFRHIAVNLWNKLDNDIKSCTSFHIFSKELRKKLLFS